MTACPCAACRAGTDPAPPLVWPPQAWFDRRNARARAILGKPAVPDLGGLPADVRLFVEREL